MYVGITQLFFNNISKHVCLKLDPVFNGEIRFFDAEPFKHAVAGTDSWNELRYLVPVFMGHIFLKVGNVVEVCVFRNSPD